MRILDIDMDFFVVEAVGGPTDKYDYELQPWHKEKVRHFLKNRCFLNSEKPIKGILCERHDEVYRRLEKMIYAGSCRDDLYWTHVDAHADLGLRLEGTNMLETLKHICTELLWREESSRPSNLKRDILWEGNWLLLAIANGWIADLTYVHHKDKNGDDYPHCFDKYWSNGTVIKLPCLNDKEFDNFSSKHELPPGTSFKTKIPFHRFKPQDFLASEPFDFAFCTRSPKYTPEKSDALIPIVSEYVDFQDTATGPIV